MRPAAASFREIEQRDLAPRAAYDEVSANLERDRLISEAQRLEAAIAAQIETCEAQEKRLRAEEPVIRSCKQYLHYLDGARLRVVEGYGGGDVAAVREQIKATQDEIAQLQRLPVPSDDLGERIARYVAALRAQPVITGISDGQDLRVLFPLRADADRVTMSGFSGFEANALLMAAFMDGERLAQRLTEVALAGRISSGERDRRLRGLQEQLIALRYDEEQAICASGADVTRDAPPWAVLMVQVEHEQQAAA
jgi:hypothetical protein